MPARILLFLLLGAGSLLLEIAWVHRQVVMFGAHPAAWGSVLAVFFAGTAAGARLMAGRDWQDIPRPLRLAGPTVAVLLSLVLPSSLDRFVSVLPVSGMAMDLARWIIVPSALLPVCLLFGIVFPVLARRTGPAPLILLYGMQAFGSFWGIYLGAFRLPYVAGHRLSGLAGGLLVIAAMLLLELVAFRVAPAAQRAGNALPRPTAVLAFGSGVCSILLQVLWTRLIALVTDDSVYAFGSVSLLVLSLLVVAGIVVAALPERIANGPLPLALALAVCAPGILLAAGIFLSDHRWALDQAHQQRHRPLAVDAPGVDAGHPRTPGAGFPVCPAVAPLGGNSRAPGGGQRPGMPGRLAGLAAADLPCRDLGDDDRRLPSDTHSWAPGAIPVSRWRW